MANITIKVLNSQVDILNKMTNRNPNKIYDLCFVYGGVKLVLRSINNGSETDISIRGTKKEISNIITAIINVLHREVK